MNYLVTHLNHLLLVSIAGTKSIRSTSNLLFITLKDSEFFLSVILMSHFASFEHIHIKSHKAEHTCKARTPEAKTHRSKSTKENTNPTSSFKAILHLPRLNLLLPLHYRPFPPRGY